MNTIEDNAPAQRERPALIHRFTDRLSYIARKLTDVYIFDFDFVDVEDDADDDEEYDSPYSSSTHNGKNHR